MHVCPRTAHQGDPTPRHSLRSFVSIYILTFFIGNNTNKKTPRENFSDYGGEIKIEVGQESRSCETILLNQRSYSEENSIMCFHSTKQIKFPMHSLSIRADMDSSDVVRNQHGFSISSAAVAIRESTGQVDA